VKSKSKLLQVVGALHTAGSLTSRLHRWKKQTNQDANNSNYY
jgi:hypothetical protein